MKRATVVERAAIVAAVLVSGCSGLVATDTLPPPAGAAPAAAAAVPRALAGAGEVETTFVDLPPVGGWPRVLRTKGPVYALAQFSPYVGQLGVLSDYERADAGMGYGVVFGYRMPMGGAKALSFEAIYEQSSHTSDATGRDATATRIVAASRLSMKMDDKLMPFVVAGGGMYALDFDGLPSEYNLSGLGVMLGGGVDYSPSPGFLIRAEVDVHVWGAAEESGSGGTAQTLTLVVGAAVSF